MLEILYQDDHYVAVNKPSGVLVHRSKIDPRANQLALQIVRDQVGQYVFPIHRLDKPTSGVLIFGLSKPAAQQLASQFANRQVKKVYLAIARGYMAEEDEIDYPLKEVQDKTTDNKARQNKTPQSAITVYRKLAQVELPFAVGRYQTARYSLVHLYPKTGRKHQLRRHMKHIFHPILGDSKYGDWRHNRFLEEQFGCRQLLLHASSLYFFHPFLNKDIDLEATPEPLFQQVIDKMGFELTKNAGAKY